MSYYTKIIIPAIAAATLSTAAIPIIVAPTDTSQLQQVTAKAPTFERASFTALNPITGEFPTLSHNGVEVKTDKTPSNVTVLADGRIQASKDAKITFASVNITSKPKPKPVVVATAVPTPAPAPITTTAEGAIDAPAAVNAPLTAAASVPAPATAQPRPVAPATGSTAEKVVQIANSYLGVNYVWGGTSPTSGWDCSGYTQFVYQQAGISISRINQWEGKTRVSLADARPGDLVVQNGGTHVGIYLGNGRMTSALNPSQGTMEHSIDIMPAEFYRVF